MASATGIEIGPDSFLFAGVRSSRSSGTEVFAARRYDAASGLTSTNSPTPFGRSATRIDFPGTRQLSYGVTTDTVDGSPQYDLLGSLTTAGFHVASVLTPPQALTRVAATVRRGTPADAIAWLALNTWGASIAIVRDGVMLFSRNVLLDLSIRPSDCESAAASTLSPHRASRARARTRFQGCSRFAWRDRESGDHVRQPAGAAFAHAASD